MGTEKNNKKDKWINNMKKELQGLDEGFDVSIHQETIRVTLKKVAKWKTSGHDGIHEFWFLKKSCPSITKWLLN